MELPSTNSVAYISPSRPLPTSESKSPLKPGSPIQKDNAPRRGSDGPPQKSLEEMMKEMMGDIKPWAQEIRDFAETTKIRQNIAYDLLAVQAAVKQYLAEHLDQEGAIDVSGVLVTLPETSPLRTDTTTEVTLKTLMEYYGKAQPKLKLPGLPTTSAAVGSYMKKLQVSIDTAQEGLSQDEGYELKVAEERRTTLLETMKALMTAYLQLMTRMVSPR